MEKDFHVGLCISDKYKNIDHIHNFFIVKINKILNSDNLIEEENFYNDITSNINKNTIIFPDVFYYIEYFNKLEEFINATKERNILYDFDVLGININNKEQKIKELLIKFINNKSIDINVYPYNLMSEDKHIIENIKNNSIINIKNIINNFVFKKIKILNEEESVNTKHTKKIKLRYNVGSAPFFWWSLSSRTH